MADPVYINIINLNIYLHRRKISSSKVLDNKVRA